MCGERKKRKAIYGEKLEFNYFLSTRPIVPSESGHWLDYQAQKWKQTMGAPSEKPSQEGCADQRSNMCCQSYQSNIMQAAKSSWLHKSDPKRLMTGTSVSRRIRWWFGRLITLDHLESSKLGPRIRENETFEVRVDNIFVVMSTIIQPHEILDDCLLNIYCTKEYEAVNWQGWRPP